MKLIYILFILLMTLSCSDNQLQTSTQNTEDVTNKIISVINISEQVTEFKHTNDDNHSIKVTMAPELGSFTYYSLGSKVNTSKIIVQEQGLTLVDHFSKIGPVKLKNYKIELHNIEETNLSDTKFKIGDFLDSDGKKYPLYIEVVKKSS